MKREKVSTIIANIARTKELSPTIPNNTGHPQPLPNINELFNL
jgi:hypothetical protein